MVSSIRARSGQERDRIRYGNQAYEGPEMALESRGNLEGGKERVNNCDHSRITRGGLETPS